MLSFSLSAFSFPLQTTHSGRRGLTSWEDPEGLITPGGASGLPLRKTVFYETFSSGVFVNILEKMVPQWIQMCHLGRPGRRFVATFWSLLPTLFFIETTVFYHGFATFVPVN